MTVNWTQRGLNRLDGIVRDIAMGDGLQTALKWHDNIFNATERLADFPLSGRVVPEIASNQIREIILSPYRIIYKVHGNTCDILSVRHSRRLIKALSTL